MGKRIAIIFAVLLCVLMGCKETTVTVISTRPTVYNFSVVSNFDGTVDEFVFTIDTVKGLIYNEDSMMYGTRVDSLMPKMTQTFVKVMIDDTISLYSEDSVFIDFTMPRRMTVTSSTGDTASYIVTINVHTVPQDSFVWEQRFDLGAGIIERQKAVITDDDVMYWMTKSGGEIVLMSSRDGFNWFDESVDGLSANVDIEHLTAVGDKICVMEGNDMYVYDGSSWTKSITTSSVNLRHLLFRFNGATYALGVGNVILKLEGTQWKTAAELASGFPVEGECAFVGETKMGLPVAYVACGIDENGKYLPDVWSTENGSHWVKLNIKESVCTPRTNAAVIQYGSGLLMLGGTTADSLVDDDYLFSKDYGVTWQVADTVYDIDTSSVRSYCKREGLSMMLKTSGEVFVVGGRDSLHIVKGDVWRGLHYSSIPGFER